MQAALLPVLGHAARPLRHTAGTCAVTIVNLTGLGTWPELVAVLAEGLDAAGDVNRVEGALDLVYKVRRRLIALGGRAGGGSGAAVVTRAAGACQAPCHCTAAAALPRSSATHLCTHRAAAAADCRGPAAAAGRDDGRRAAARR